MTTYVIPTITTSTGPTLNPSKPKRRFAVVKPDIVLSAATDEDTSCAGDVVARAGQCSKARGACQFYPTALHTFLPLKRGLRGGGSLDAAISKMRGFRSLLECVVDKDKRLIDQLTSADRVCPVKSFRYSILELLLRVISHRPFVQSEKVTKHKHESGISRQ